ncbi:hypothetical protein Psfp_03686 [Pelotomaculum sp. FP]|uniref:hypothetical protein n=1 Tax=Pelotomaculum sp. FP TaxID=261474 RepID=UPI001065A7E6|nr:hypothetical protein [Pelotomaculum sp. FP]TEB12663.1 hypothetical protein Psfp_03686 [Pelotomaculum sp. FP]
MLFELMAPFYDKFMQKAALDHSGYIPEWLEPLEGSEVLDRRYREKRCWAGRRRLQTKLIAFVERLFAEPATFTSPDVIQNNSEIFLHGD